MKASAKTVGRVLFTHPEDPSVHLCPASLLLCQRSSQCLLCVTQINLEDNELDVAHPYGSQLLNSTQCIGTHSIGYSRVNNQCAPRTSRCATCTCAGQSTSHMVLATAYGAGRHVLPNELTNQCVRTVPFAQPLCRVHWRRRNPGMGRGDQQDRAPVAQYNRRRLQQP